MSDLALMSYGGGYRSPKYSKIKLKVFFWPRKHDKMHLSVGEIDVEEHSPVSHVKFLADRMTMVQVHVRRAHKKN